MTDLWLFSKLLFEVGMLCGFLPSIFLVYAAEAWAKAERVPARNQRERWSMWKMQKRSSPISSASSMKRAS
jgi:hypothetical protein